MGIPTESTTAKAAAAATKPKKELLLGYATARDVEN